MSLGEDRIRVSFNASESGDVDVLKRKSAELINLVESLREQGKDGRLISLAQTKYEEAAMYAVKAATS
jgi:hypothetical protein